MCDCYGWKKRRRIAILTGAFVAMCAWCRADDYAVHVVDPPITDYLVLPDAPLPAVCKEAKGIKLHACPGEYEPASFVLTASKPLESVRVEVDGVTGPGGPWPAEAVDVRVVKEYYRGTLAGGAAAIPTLLVHNERLLAIEPAPTKEDPKAMKNVAKGKLRDTAELQPVTIERRKQFWITVHVPASAKPGTYHTTVRIVPQGAQRRELTVQIDVHPFELLPPMVEYSMYYPTYLLPPGKSAAKFGQVSAEQYCRELRNMLAHGLANPNIYGGLAVSPEGKLDFSALARILELRESVGMRPEALYLISHPLVFTDRPLTPEERQRTNWQVREINTWAKKRGYDRVFFAANDEWWGDRLSRERDSMVAVNEAGGRVYVAVMHATFYDRVGDALTRPVLKSPIGAYIELAAKRYSPRESLRHMAEIGKAGSFQRTRDDEEFRKAIDGMHRQGKQIFTYMNPVAGLPLPDLQRRNEGLGLWRVGFDGTMTWAYVHIAGDEVNQGIIFAKVYRTADGVIDTLWWEGFREGVDDVRYLTTLLATLRDAAGRFPDDPLVDQTWQWIRGLDVADGDLDAIRREMARRIIALRDLGYKELPPEEVLADVDIERIKVVTFPEPWQFKIDPDDLGVKQKWFDPDVDDRDWGSVRTDQGVGWEKQGFAEQQIGYGWYRARLPLAAGDLATKFKWLYFEAVDEDAWVYLNGEKIFDHTFETTGLPPSRIWLTPFSVPLSGADLGGGDVLVVRVKNTGSMGGIWKPVHMVHSERSLTKRQLRSLLELHQQKDKKKP